MQRKTWGAVIVAAGTGSRFASNTPKQFLRLRGKPLIDWSIDTFSSIAEISEIVVVLPRDEELWKPYWKPSEKVRTVPGGIRRQDSVLEGLRALDSHRWVLVHDAARPLVSAGIVHRVMKGTEETGAAVPVVSVRDTVKRISSESLISGTVPRDDLRMSQTPQGFRLDILEKVLSSATDVTDECSAMEQAGHEVLAVNGDLRNMKLTDPSDFAIVEELVSEKTESRNGIGLDFHPFARGRPLIIGGCRIDGSMGLSGHSDGDAVLHAIADALLSASRLGDIGIHFPPGDEKWKNADSAVLLRTVNSIISRDGWTIRQIDVTVISDLPRIAPIRDQLISRIAGILSVSPDTIWVKGTTTNTLGDIGKGKGLGCMAMAVISRSIPGTEVESPGNQ
ncbi:MAG: 2-C-methyl-D-erythritol 4-phosphate cytidylyltransferase [Candidatus Aegiribacteria sp.]|nr:2-C-methyl-D-erythritol 4-phosphate cytidylyltransferase [Candidatus Aegiribacteria sp.]